MIKNTDLWSSFSFPEFHLRYRDVIPVMTSFGFWRIFGLEFHQCQSTNTQCTFFNRTRRVMGQSLPPTERIVHFFTTKIDFVWFFCHVWILVWNNARINCKPVHSWHTGAPIFHIICTFCNIRSFLTLLWYYMHA